MTQPETTNAYRQELREQILHTATDLFYRHGVRQVKMDDIATTLSISKRTLYEIYANKADLLFEVVATCERRKEERMRQFVENHTDPMDIVVEFYRSNIEELTEINPQFFEDVHKYPAITSYLREVHETRANHSSDFLQRAMADGYFRTDVNYDIFKRIGDAASQYFMATKLYRQFPLEELFHTLLMVMLRGICTEKGVKAIDAHLA